VILGSYGLRIQGGEITIAGASLPSGVTIHWIHTPHCHALPVIRTTKDSVLELHSHPAAKDIRSLGGLSPLFGRLWNDKTQTSSHPDGEKHEDTYHMVRWRMVLVFLNVLDIVNMADAV
jgi:polynucleotide 5'-hydroxyl-kinase GRC3/NOL9